MSVTARWELGFDLGNEQSFGHEDLSRYVGGAALDAELPEERVEAIHGALPRPVVTPPVEIDRSALPFKDFHLSAVASPWDQPRH
jgi:hypothetical protein